MRRGYNAVNDVLFLQDSTKIRFYACLAILMINIGVIVILNPNNEFNDEE